MEQTVLAAVFLLWPARSGFAGVIVASILNRAAGQRHAEAVRKRHGPIHDTRALRRPLHLLPSPSCVRRGVLFLYPWAVASGQALEARHGDRRPGDQET